MSETFCTICRTGINAGVFHSHTYVMIDKAELAAIHAKVERYEEALTFLVQWIADNNFEGEFDIDLVLEDAREALQRIDELLDKTPKEPLGCPDCGSPYYPDDEFEAHFAYCPRAKYRKE